MSKKSWLLIVGGMMSLFVSCHKKDALPERQSQELWINMKKDPVSLDPRRGNDMAASQIHFMLFEGLVRLEPDMSISPAQASSYDISPDGKTYTFHLAKTVWSDGNAVTADDFAKSWKSMLDPKFPCPDAYLLYPIKNAKPAKKGEVELSEVGIFAKDPKTLVVELEAPAPHFLQVVASSVLLPVSARVDAAHPDWAGLPELFVGNGPFALKGWKLNQEIILEKNPHYRDAANVSLNRIFVEIINRELASMHMYASGHFDLIGAPLSFFPETLLHDLSKKQLLTVFPVATTKFLAFNTTTFPFDNANIRRAFAYAIDRKAITNHITQLQEKVALRLIPPSLMGEEPQPIFADADETRAKECLEKGLDELGISVKDLGKVSFMCVSTEINHLIAQELHSRWMKVLGIDVSLEHVEFKTLHERAKRGDFSIGVFAWLADYGDPMNILERFIDKTCQRNYAKWESEGYNYLVQDALKAPSREKYFEKVKEAEKFLVEEMPITGLFHDNYVFLIQPHVRGLQVSPLGHIYFERIFLGPKHLLGEPKVQ